MILFISSSASSSNSASLPEYPVERSAVMQNTQASGRIEYASPTPSGTTSPYPQRLNRGWDNWLVLDLQRLERQNTGFEYSNGSFSPLFAIIDSPRKWRSTPFALAAKLVYLECAVTAFFRSSIFLAPTEGSSSSQLGHGPSARMNASLAGETALVTSVLPWLD